MLQSDLITDANALMVAAFDKEFESQCIFNKPCNMSIETFTFHMKYFGVFQD